VKILITGATGFVGASLAESLAREDHFEILAGTRSERSALGTRYKFIRCPELGSSESWTNALAGVDVVVHAAARVHIAGRAAENPSSLAEFERINVQGTLELAKQASLCGVRRFIYISSIKVNGEKTQPGVPFRAEDIPKPQGAYAISKYHAERALLSGFDQHQLQGVIIRPPLMYGPGVKANFLELMKLVYRRVPLPLGGVDNARSLLSLVNLCSLVKVCIHHPNAPHRVFLASDGDDISTTRLLRLLAHGMGVNPRLFWVPKTLLTAAAVAMGRRPLIDRLLGCLQVDISDTFAALGWTPPISTEEGVITTARHFLKTIR
jgi:UDP-N-acetyl-alpha-D-quinovosamine dehydrogenase